MYLTQANYATKSKLINGVFVVSVYEETKYLAPLNLPSQ